MTHRFSRLLSVSLLIVLCSYVFNKSAFGHEVKNRAAEMIGPKCYKAKHIKNYKLWKSDIGLNTRSLPEEESYCVYKIAMSVPGDPPIDSPECRSSWEWAYVYSTSLIDSIDSLIYCLNSFPLNYRDCDSQFDEVESDHSSYSSAISDIEYRCDE